METQVIFAKKVILPEKIIYDAGVMIVDGKITAVGGKDKLNIHESASLYNMKDKIIAPGLIDQMVHGSHGYKAGISVEETLKFAEVMIRHGVTAFLPTVAFAPTLEEMLEALALTASCVDEKSSGAEILGVNFEAPFFTKAPSTQWDRYPPAGYYAGKMARDPSVAELHQMQQAANGHIRLMTIAPELDGALDVIHEMCNLGIVPSIGHTAASFEQTRAGIDAGAKSATHLYNAMRRQDHREPGVIEAILVSDDINAELIADFVHVYPPALDIAVRCKGVDKLILVSDNLKYAGLPNGTYKDELGREIVKDDDKAHIPGWTLAGSISPLNRNVRNMVQGVGLTLPEAFRMASLNPARLLGFGDRKGSLEVGKDADLIVIDEGINVYGAMRGGQWKIKEEKL